MKFDIMLIAALLLWGTFHTHAQNNSLLLFTSEEREIILKGDTTTLMAMPPLSSKEGSRALRDTSINVDPLEPLLPILAHRMYLCVTDSNVGGVGIAAPQVGINRNLIWVQRYDKTQMPFEFFINPQILWKSELARKGVEGDLSFPERGEVLRSYVIQVEYQTLKGEKKTEIIEGFTAVIVQHEMDHLKGILLTDRAKEVNDPPYIPAAPHIQFYIPNLPKR